MSPGMLFSTGYIAGGTIAGVLIAFLNFSEPTVKTLATWQYRTTPAPAAASFDGQCQALAEKELGPKSADKQTERLIAEIRELNEPQLPGYVQVAKGTSLNLPGDKHYKAPADARLSEVAQSTLGSDDKASLLFDLNESQLKLPKALPADAKLNIPQTNGPAIVMFLLLAVFLVLVGKGWLLKTKA